MRKCIFLYPVTVPSSLSVHLQHKIYYTFTVIFFLFLFINNFSIFCISFYYIFYQIFKRLFNFKRILFLAFLKMDFTRRISLNFFYVFSYMFAFHTDWKSLIVLRYVITVRVCQQIHFLRGSLLTSPTCPCCIIALLNPLN